MSQIEIYNFLKSKPNIYFSQDDLSKNLGVSVQSICTGIKKLEHELSIQLSIDKTKHQTKLYAYKDNDDNFEEIFADFHLLRTQSKFSFLSAEVITNLLVCRELKKLNKRYEDGTAK